MERIDLAILGATSREIASLSRYFPPSEELDIAGHPIGIYRHRGFTLLVGTTGIGKVNAAAVCAAVLVRLQAAEVWNVGCSGAYRQSGLRVGDVLAARSCICGDEGILRKNGRDPSSLIGIPLLFKDGRPIYDAFPLDESLGRRQIQTKIPPGAYAMDSSGIIRQGCPQSGDEGCFSLVYGPSLTVGMVSGDIETADERFRLHGALAENMEGSAVAQVCFLFGVPFLEIRGISNVAGVRDKKTWDFDAAIGHCSGVVEYLVRQLV